MQRTDYDETWEKQPDGTMRLISSVVVERETAVDPDVELATAIAAATNFDELKAALLGQIRPGRAAGRPV